MPMQSFTASVHPGSGRGKGLGVPTLNLAMESVPGDMEEGVYACFVTAINQRFPATMHYGPRPVFKDNPSCEVHILDTTLESQPSEVTVEPIEYLRPVQDFGSAEALVEQMNNDCSQARAILKT